jgi:hypothetical protein
MGKKLIFISEISILIGKLNKNLVKTFENVLKRVDNIEYNKYVEEIKNKIEKNKEELKGEVDIDVEKVKKLEIINNEYEKTVLSRDEYIEKRLGIDNFKNVIKIKDNIEEKEEILKTIINKEVRDMTESFINTNYGIMKEDDALTIYEKMNNIKVIRRQEATMRQMQEEYYIYGKIDGIIDNNENKYIIEVKNRVNYLFRSLREYEKVQIQLYMYSMNIGKSKLIEKYKDEINVIEIELDVEYVEIIIKKINSFINKLKIFITDKEIKENYMKLISEKEKEDYLNKYYLLEIKKLI